jgi:hypothetical protein
MKDSSMRRGLAILAELDQLLRRRDVPAEARNKLIDARDVLLTGLPCRIVGVYQKRQEGLWRWPRPKLSN